MPTPEVFYTLAEVAIAFVGFAAILGVLSARVEVWPAEVQVMFRALIEIGLIVLYSSSGQDLDQIQRQSIRLLVAFLVMIAVAQIPPLQLRRWSPGLFGLSIALLLAVLIFGEVGKGAQRWLDLYFFRFQPSELSKVAVPMMIAWFLAEKSPEYGSQTSQ